MEKETKKCPHCGGEILAVAKKCKHCKRWIEEETEEAIGNETAENNPKDKNIWLLCAGAIGIIVIIVVLFFIFTGNKIEYNTYDETTESFIGTVDEFNDVAAESATIEDIASFTSHDLSTLFLKGHVKTVVEYKQDYNEFKDIYVFDTSGSLVEYHNKYTDDEEGNKIVRRNGRIVSLGNQAYALVSVTEFGYDSADRCIFSNSHTGHGSDEYTYTSFNEHGFPSAADLSGYYSHQGDEQSWSGKASFSYPSIDGMGNWTRCVKKINKEIINTVYDDDGNEDNVNETTNLTEVLIREITYY